MILSIWNDGDHDSDDHVHRLLIKPGEPHMFAVRRRRRAARLVTVIMAIGAFAALALPAASAATSRPASPSSASSTAPASHTTCVTTGVSTTCTGTASGNNAYNPWTSQPDWNSANGTGTWRQISHPPVVTVSQTKDLTDQVVNVSWQYFTPSLDVSGNPDAGGNSQNYEVTVYECKGTNPTWDSNGLGTWPDPNSCYESGEGVPGLGALGNALVAGDSNAGITYEQGACGIPASWVQPGSISPGCTNGGDPADWKGSAQFHIETGTTNSSLGCDVHSPCSLVIVPNFGGELPVGTRSNTDTSVCENHFDDSVAAEGGQEALAYASSIDGACSYMDRIVVPLSFAPTPTDCPASAIQNPDFYAEGSPMMARQMTQWQTAWCRSPAGSLDFSSVSEDSARNSFLAGGQSLGSGTDMALTTLPASGVASSRKFTYAPLANSGTAIAYYLDDAVVANTNPKTGAQIPNPVVGQPINRMVLDPLLAAKLTTESYALAYGCQNSSPPPPWSPPPDPSPYCDPAVWDNTSYLFTDPEFLSLNKNCQPTGAPNHACNQNDFPVAGDVDGTMGFGPFLPTMLGSYSDMTWQLTDWVGANAEAQAFLAGTPVPGMHVNTYYKGTSYPSELLAGQDPGLSWPGGLKCIASGAYACATTNAGSNETASMNVAWNFDASLEDIVQNLLAFQPNADSPYLTCTALNNAPCSYLNQWEHAALGPQVPGTLALMSEMDLGDVGAYLFPAAALVNADGQAVAPTQASVEATVTKAMKTNQDGITQYVNQSSMDPDVYPLTMVDYAMVPTCGLKPAQATAIADFLDNVATTGQRQGVLPGQLQPGYYPLTSAQRAQTLKAAQDVRTQDCKSAPPDRTDDGGSSDSSSSPAKAAASDHRTPSSGSTPIGRTRTAAFGQKSADSGLAGILLVLAIVFGALIVVGGPTAWVITVTGRWPVVLGQVRAVRARSLTGLGRLVGLVVRRA
jgi:hypothetical protein